MAEAKAPAARPPIFPRNVKIGIFVALLVLTGLQALRAVLYGPREEPAGLFSVAPFRLTDQSGHAFDSASLAGKVWIASFVFTSCRDVCPTITTKVSNLASRLSHEPRVRFVSFSVDPEVDTPERLRAYATRFGADPARWSFLTGSLSDVSRVVRGVLHQPMEPTPDDGGTGYQIVHDMRLTLVDATGVVRGLYATDREGLAQIEADARRLAAEIRD